MYMDALESEVESLSAEVTRLRLMVHRVSQMMEGSQPPAHCYTDPMAASMSRSQSSYSQYPQQLWHGAYSGVPFFEQRQQEQSYRESIETLQALVDTYQRVLPADIVERLLSQQSERQRPYRSHRPGDREADRRDRRRDDPSSSTSRKKAGTHTGKRSSRRASSRRHAKSPDTQPTYTTTLDTDEDEEEDEEHMATHSKPSAVSLPLPEKHKPTSKSQRDKPKPLVTEPRRHPRKSHQATPSLKGSTLSESLRQHSRRSHAQEDVAEDHNKTSEADLHDVASVPPSVEMGSAFLDAQSTTGHDGATKTVATTSAVAATHESTSFESESMEMPTMSDSGAANYRSISVVGHSHADQNFNFPTFSGKPARAQGSPMPADSRQKQKSIKEEGMAMGSYTRNVAAAAEAHEAQMPVKTVTATRGERTTTPQQQQPIGGAAKVVPAQTNILSFASNEVSSPDEGNIPFMGGGVILGTQSTFAAAPNRAVTQPPQISTSPVQADSSRGVTAGIRTAHSNKTILERLREQEESSSSSSSSDGRGAGGNHTRLQPQVDLHNASPMSSVAVSKDVGLPQHHQQRSPSVSLSYGTGRDAYSFGIYTPQQSPAQFSIGASPLTSPGLLSKELAPQSTHDHSAAPSLARSAASWGGYDYDVAFGGSANPSHQSATVLESDGMSWLRGAQSGKVMRSPSRSSEDLQSGGYYQF